MSKKKNITISHIRSALSGIPFPATRKDIIEYVRNKGVGDGIIDFFKEKLPDQEFNKQSHILSSLNIK